MSAAADHLAPSPDSQSFSIGANADTAITFTERRYGQLHGFVKDEQGAALPDLWVYANNGYQSFAVQTQSNGSWSIRGPPTVGSQLYTVYVPVGTSFPTYANYEREGNPTIN